MSQRALSCDRVRWLRENLDWTRVAKVITFFVKCAIPFAVSTFSVLSGTRPTWSFADSTHPTGGQGGGEDAQCQERVAGGGCEHGSIVKSTTTTSDTHIRLKRTKSLNRSNLTCAKGRGCGCRGIPGDALA